MIALVKTKPGPGNLNLIDVKEPECDENHLKIEIKYAGICGTDIHVKEDTFKNYPPVILGHELSGVIVEKGKNIKKYKPGDFVTILGSTSVLCGDCEYCKSGYYVFCKERRGMGHGTNGGFCKYVVVREDMIYPIQKNFSLKIASLAEPLATAVQAVEELCTILSSDTILVSGPGPIGLLCLALLVNKGCKVIMTGTSSDHSRFLCAKKLGAYKTIDVVKENVDNIINSETEGRGADVIIECSGSFSAVNKGLQLVKKLGKYIQVGISGRKEEIDWDTILYKQLRVFGSIGHTHKSWEKVIRIFNNGEIDFSPIISHEFPLSEWEEAFDLVENKQGNKILLYPD